MLNPSAPYAEGRTLWTIQMDVNPTAIIPSLAGICWTGTEFWVAKWNSDSLWTLNAAGAVTGSPFVIAGITGARSITTDGTYMYIGANTTDIYQVDKTTKTLISTITTAVTNVRFLTYDPTLNSNAGGFWTGSFTTDITAVSMTGATLSSIPAATHTLTGMYGMAYDSYSLVGPYLWAFDQGTTGATLVQIKIATGAPTGLTHNTQVDLAGGSNVGLAGGAFITNSLVAGQKTIGGISQGTSIFAYELSEPSGISDLNGNTFNLSVYPNPTSSTANVSFQLTTENNVKVEVLNVLGSAVYTANQGALNAGNHIITLDNKNLDNGIYFVKLTAGNQSVSSKVTIMK